MVRIRQEPLIINDKDLIKTAIDGVVIIELQIFEDASGYFFENCL